jgi:hypothetical protein
MAAFVLGLLAGLPRVNCWLTGAHLARLTAARTPGWAVYVLAPLLVGTSSTG